jgi:hypothetical protein
MDLDRRRDAVMRMLGKMLTPKTETGGGMRLDQREKLAHRLHSPEERAQAYAIALMELSRVRTLELQYNMAVSIALSKYGDFGPLISGVVRDHFPDDVKKELRTLAWSITDATDSSYVAWRQSGRKTHTWRALYHARKGVAA